MNDFTGMETGKAQSLAHINEPLTGDDQPRKHQFFNAADLKAILREQDCIGIRFYPLTIEDDTFKLVAVGVFPNRGEIERSMGYVQSEGASPSVKMSFSEARQVVTPDTNSYSAYFSKMVINEFLSDINCIGVRIYEDTWNITSEEKSTERVSNLNIEEEQNSFPSLGMIGVGKDMRNIEEDAYVLSDMPCPPDCGDDPDYLFKLSLWTNPAPGPEVDPTPDIDPAT